MYVFLQDVTPEIVHTCPVTLIGNLVTIMHKINSELLWLYPFSWVVIIVRKIFYA